jgi:FKBP-type peptidyl-prolyl cis-trans isomerase FklB
MKELSYQVGLLVGGNLANQVNPEDMDLLSLARGIEDAINGVADDATMDKAARQVQAYMQDVLTSRAKASLGEERAFLEQNAKRPEVLSRPSGLQYEILKAGDGKTPLARNTVMAHYEGRLLDGSIFDSSIMRGEPAQFPVGNLIQGWQEALQIMPVGSKWRLYIPHNLGYGERGAGADIPPFATLIFDLELISIVS